MSSPLLRTTRLAFAFLFSALALPASGDVREIEWNELMPEEEAEAWMKNQSGVDHTGTGPGETFQSDVVVPGLDGKDVRIAGFVVPVETDAEGMLKTFFLVPYFGACIHVPPPPANQIIYGRLDEPIEMVNIWDAFWMQGTLNVEDVSNETADAAYTMDVDSLTLY